MLDGNLADDLIKIGIILLIIAVIFVGVYLGDQNAQGAWVLEYAGIFLAFGGFLSLLAGLVDAFRHS